MSETASIPNHIGLILDGNRRWARAQGLPSFEGHRIGYELLERIAQKCFDRGVKYVSAYVFSLENWKRDQKEVDYLMRLSHRVFAKNLRKLHAKNIKICFLGERDRLSSRLQQAIKQTEELTRGNTGGVLALCFNYGGRDEIVAATKKLLAAGTQPEDITEQAIHEAMMSSELPDPDLIVRTSGERRLSNFLLWGSAYAELYFTPVMWPEFNEHELDVALSDYAGRQRRYGQ